MGRRLLWCLVAAALAAGCTNVPSETPARVVRRVPAEDAGPPEPQVIRRVAENPDRDATPDEIVRAFLRAQNEPQDDYAIARRHVAPQSRWEDEGRTVVYASREIGAPRAAGDRASVAVTLRPVGEIATTGDYRPRSAPVLVTFRLRLVPTLGWRVVDPPSGLLLTRDGVAASFHRATLYWPHQARRLVPNLVFLRANDHPVRGALRALLAGPRGWLGPAVRTAIPDNTELLGPPEIVDGTATVRFSRELSGAPRETVGMLVAQLVWTLTEHPEVQVVRVLVEDKPLQVPDRPGVSDHRREDWADYAPSPPTADRRMFFVSEGTPYALDDVGRRSRVARVPALESFAVNRAGTVLAGVTRRGSGGQALVLADLAGDAAPRTVFARDRITAPTWEPNGKYFWVATSTGAEQQIAVVPAEGGLTAFVRVPPALPSPVTSLRLSPDGARLAIVAGAPGAAFVARIERTASGGRVVADPIRLLPTVRDVTALAFDGPTHLLVGGVARRRPALYRVDVDGYGVDVVGDAGLPAGQVTGLAVSASTPPDRVVASDGRLWRRAPGAAWVPLRYRGAAPAFAG